MQKALLMFVALISYTSVFSQITNPDFETSRNVSHLMPQGWGNKKAEGFSMALDQYQKYAGKQSLRIIGARKASASSFMPFFQEAPISVNHLKQITLICYVKTESVVGNVQLWCQVWNKNHKMISFQDSQIQSSALTGTNGWQKMQLRLIVDTDAKRLFLGGCLKGSGTAWFDSFTIEEKAIPSRNALKPVLQFAKELTALIKNKSIYRDSIRWATVDIKIAEASKVITSVDTAEILTDYIFSQLRKVGDYHSFFQNKIIAQNYAAVNTVIGQPQGKLLRGNIGYILIPGFGSTNNAASVNFAKKIQGIIQDLDSKSTIKGWIVDLRKDGGGNMYPMIVGLGPLLNEGTLGYFISPGAKSAIESSWFYRNGSSGNNGRPFVTIRESYTIRKYNTKVAILIGSGTASSGEMTAICFIGKQNTKLFGQPSAGYIIANQGFKLSTGAMLYLSTSYVADRNKKKYLVNIRPDVIINTNNPTTSDATLDAAWSWVNK